jgi:hypothetical protein
MLSGEAWHTFLSTLIRQLIGQLPAHRLLPPSRPLLSPACGLAQTPSSLPREHTSTIPPGLLHKPSARFPLVPEARLAGPATLRLMLSFGQLLDC